LVLLALAVLAVPQAASANAVLYSFRTTATFEFEGTSLTSRFSFEVPAIITGTGFTLITSLLSASNTGSFWRDCGPISFVDIVHPSSSTPDIFVNTNRCGATFFFTTPIDTFGTFVSPSFSGGSTLTISETPEPTSMLLFGSGLLLFGMIVGRKQRAARIIGLVDVP
jgi:hypothetical protein